MKNTFDHIRDQFPRLKNSSLIYLDSAATMQKPDVVIDTMSRFYREQYGTVHRAIYKAAQEATHLYSEARTSLARYIHAKSPSEIIFTRGTTDSLNIIAESLAKGVLKKTSKILISGMEHHANIVPWQLAAERTGASIHVIPVGEDGSLSLPSLRTMLEEGGVDVVSLTHGSNILGTIPPIKEIAGLVKDAGALFIVDGAQTAGHVAVDVSALGCDFFCFSAHKMCGPTGIGVLWGKEELLEKMPPTRGGGDMIDVVTFEKSTWNDLPLKFEPGTPAIAEAVGFGAAVEYVQALGIGAIAAWEHELFEYFLEKSKNVPDFHRIGTVSLRCPLQSFFLEHVHALDLATFLDIKNIAVRSGSLCGQPLLKRFGVRELVRVSFAFYNTKEEIDLFIEALQTAVRTLARP